VWAQIASGLTEEDAGYQNDPADVWAEAPGAALVAGGVGGNGGGIGWYYPASVLRYQTSGAELLWSLTTGGYDDDAVTSLHAIWGSAPDDVYAVGDIAFDLSAGTGEMAIRYDGSGWGTVAGSACTDGGGFLYPELGAVAGSAADDVWFGGCAGAFAHFDGAAWTAEIAAPEGVGDIWRVDDLWVGGPAQALAAVIAMPSAAPFVPIPLLAWDGAAWSAVTMLPAGFGAPFLNDPTAVCEGAVAATGSDDVYASGLLFDDDPNSPLGIALAHFDGASWSLVPLDGIDLSGPPWPCINDLWISPEGAVWGVLSGGRALRYVPCDEGMGSRPITCHIRFHRAGRTDGEKTPYRLSGRPEPPHAPRRAPRAHLLRRFHRAAEDVG
jgi:hypothetical protein